MTCWFGKRVGESPKRPETTRGLLSFSLPLSWEELGSVCHNLYEYKYVTDWGEVVGGGYDLIFFGGLRRLLYSLRRR